MNGQQQPAMTEAELARAELYATLGQLSQKLNVAQRFDDAVDETIDRVKEEKSRNPVAFALAVAGIACGVGVAVWFGASRLLKR